MKRGAWVGGLGASVLLVATARADEPPAPPAEVTAQAPLVPRPRRHWYGWETLLSDGVSIVTAPMVVGIPGFFLATPITHLAHGNAGAAAASFGMRASGVAILGVGAAREDTRGDFGVYSLIPYALAATAVWAGAIAIDASALAYEDVPPPKAATLELAPTAAPLPGGGFALGLGGTM